MATNGLGIGSSPDIAALVQQGTARRREQQAQQEAEALVQLEALRREREKNRSRSIGEIAGDTGLGLLGGAVDLGSAGYGLANIASGGFLDEATGGFSQNFGETTEAIQGWQSEPLQLRREDANAAFDDGLGAGAGAYLSDPSLLFDMVARTVPSLVPTIAAGNLAARTVGAVGTRQAAQQAATRAAIGTSGAQIAGGTNVEAVDTLREQGVDGLERQGLGVAAGLGAGILGAGITRLTGAGQLEAAIGSRIAGLGGTGGGIARGAVGGVLREGGEEAVQSPVETAAVNAVAPDNSLLEGTGRAAVMGGIGGALVGGPMGAFSGGGQTPAQRTQAGSQIEQDLAADEQSRLQSTLGQAARQGTMPKGGLQALIDERIQGGQKLTEQDFRSAVDVELERRGATTRLDANGDPILMRTNPDTQVLEPVTAEERQQVEQELQTYVDGTSETNDLFGEPATPPAAEPEAAPLDLSGGVDPVYAAIQARTDELAGMGMNPDEAAAVAGQELNPQQALDLTQDERDSYALGQVFEQQGLLFEQEDGTLAVNEDQRELFDQSTQGMTPAEQQTEIEKIAAARQKVREEGQRVRELVERSTNVDREPAVASQRDLLSRQAAQKQEQARRQEEIIADRFRVEEGEDGGPVYKRYNANIQAMEEVPRSVAVKEANAVITEQDAAAKEAARPPADRWKDTLAERFGLPKNTMPPNSNEWKAFSDAANERRIQPDSPEAEAFLAEQAAVLGSNFEGANKFGKALGDWLVEQVGTEQSDALFRAARGETEATSQQDPAQNTTEAIAEQEQAQAERPPSFGDQIRQREEAGLPLTSVIRGRDNLPFSSRASAQGAKKTKWLQNMAAENNVDLDKLEPREISDGSWELQVTNYNDEAAQQSQQEQTAESAPELQQAVETEAAVNTTRSDRAKQELANFAAQLDKRVEEDVESNLPRGKAVDPAKAKNATYKSLETELNISSTTEELDQTFSTFLVSKAFNSLDVDRQRKLTAKYNSLHDKLDPGSYFRVSAADNAVVDQRTEAQREAGDPAAPARGPTRRERRAERKRQKNQTSTPLTAERSAELLQNENVQVHATVAEYKIKTRRAAPTDAAGVFDRNGVHVILENVKTEEQLAEVLAHERAHGGIQTLLGDRLPAITNRLWANAALRERIRYKMQTQSLDRSAAAEEVLADMLATNERLTGDVWSKIRSGIQSVFETILGVSNYRVTDRQVDSLLDDVSRKMRDPGAASLRATALTEGQMPLDALLGEPTAVTSTPRFSRAMEIMNSVVPRANPEAGNHNRMDSAVREATEASIGRFRGVYDEVKNGNYGRSLGGYTMPLNQMVNMWGRNFDRVVRGEDGKVLTTENPFRNVYSLKNEQEARLNQRVVRRRDISAEGKKFHVSAHDINDQTTKYQRSNPEGANALNVSLQDSTRFQVWPNRTWEQQPEINYERHNLTEDERRSAYKELRKQWSKMGQEGQDLYLKIQASYADIWQSRIKALEDELRRVNGLGPKDPLPDNRLLDMARRELNAGPYSPLSRVGEHLVVVKSRDGNTEHFSAYDTLTEAKYAEQGLRKDYPAQDGFAVSRSVMASRDNLRAGLNQEQLNILESALSNAVPNDASQETKNSIREALIDTYLKMIPASAFGQYSNRRNNVSGYSMDGMRAYSNYAVKGARQIASIEYDGQISQGFLEMRQHIRDKANAGENVDVEQDVYNKAVEHHKASMDSNFSAPLAKLSGAGFLYFMTSPSQLFVNATQTFIIAMPRLAARYGAAKTLRIGMESLRNYFRSGTDFLGERAANENAIDPVTQQVMQRLYEDGTLDFTLTGDLLEVSQAESGQLSSTWRNVMKYLAAPIHKSEVFNRQVTAYMAAKMHAEENGIDLSSATEEQVQSLYDVAKDAVDSTQFNYSQSNKPVVMQGPVRRLVMQFQQYRLNMLAMMAKDLRDSMGGNNASAEEKALARRSLAYLLGAQLSFTGAVGTAMSPIAFAIMDAFGDDDEDFVDSRTAFIEAVPQWMAHGLIGGVLNLDPGRVEVGSVLPFLGERNYAPDTDDFNETARYYLERNIGPWFGLTTGAIGGVKDAMAGNFYDASQGLLPKPLADGIRSVNEVDGVRNKNGVITYDTSVWDSVTRALGLRSAGAMEASVRQGAGYQAAKGIQRQRQKHLVRLAVAQATGDREAYAEAMDGITGDEGWNKKNPDFPIVGQDIGRILTSQQKAQSNVEEYGLPLARDITPAFREAAGI